METSQAVSMLQPFRHPKPGLIIMDKTTENGIWEIIDYSNMRELTSEEWEKIYNNGKGLEYPFLSNQEDK